MSTDEQSWQARLREEWQAVARPRKWLRANDAAAQAAVLTTYHTMGKLDREIAACIGIVRERVGQLLRFQRWLDWSKGTIVPLDITEGKFRAYWQQYADPHATKGPRSQRHIRYEPQVFAAIAERVEAGQPPTKPSRTLKPLTSEDIQHALDPWTTLRKEVHRIYETEMKPTLDKLDDLLHRDRWHISPSGLSDHAVLLKRSMERVMKLFDVKRTVIDVTGQD